MEMMLLQMIANSFSEILFKFGIVCLDFVKMLLVNANCHYNITRTVALEFQSDTWKTINQSKRNFVRFL